MAKSDNERIKTIPISRALLDSDSLDCKHALLALIRGLPDDFVLKNLRTRFSDDMFFIDIWSASYEPVREGDSTPTLVPVLHDTAVNRERAWSIVAEREKQKIRQTGTECICDFAYTGLKQHRFDCPARPR